MTEAERAEEAHVIETTAAMLADSRCSWFVLGFEVGDAVASDDAAHVPNGSRSSRAAAWHPGNDLAQHGGESAPARTVPQ